jgi:hypothetical protein
MIRYGWIGPEQSYSRGVALTVIIGGNDSDLCK